MTADPVMGDLRIRWFTCNWPLTLAVLAERAMPAQGRPGFVALTSGTSGPPAGPGVLVGACGGVEAVGLAGRLSHRYASCTIKVADGQIASGVDAGARR